MKTFLIILILLIVTKKKMKMNKSKQMFSNIECGFNNFLFKSFKISMNFFVIMIIFVIFDLEMAMIIPLVLNITKKKNLPFIKLSLSFLAFVILSMMYEIKFKSLTWK